MLLGLIELATIKVQTCNVEMTDRLLRKPLVRLVFAKDALEPSKGFAKVAAKTGSEREVVRHESDVMFVPQLFGKLERNSKLLLRFGPVAENDKAETARVRALQKSFGRLGNQRLGAFEKLKGLGMLTAAPCQTGERMQRFSF